MAGRGDITAGRAFVELFVKSGAFTKGLEDARKRLAAFGAGLRTIGAGFLAMGASIIGPLGIALAKFESAGSALNDMAARTGASVEALGELGFAAEQSGSSIEEVEKAIVKLQRVLAAAQSGSVEARQAFQDIGIDFHDLLALSPDEQFALVAKAIGGIEDPARRAAASVGLLGKSATSLLPMIGELDDLREEARALGRMTTEEAAKADALGDAWGRLKTIAQNLSNVVGSALAEEATRAADTIATLLKSAIEWARENQHLAKTVAAVGAALLVAGVFFTAHGTALAAILASIEMAIGAFGTLIGVVGLATTPVGVLVGALAGIGYGLYKAGVGAKELGGAFEAAGDAVSDFRDYAANLFRALSKDFSATWQGIVDAASAGNLQLAAEVAWAGLKVVWHEGTEGINQAWTASKWFFLETWGEATSVAGQYFLEMIGGFKTWWVEMIAFFESSWVKFWKSDAVLVGLGAINMAAANLAADIGLITRAEAETAKTVIRAGVMAGPAEKEAELKRIAKERADSLVQIDKDEATALGVLAKDKQAALEKNATAYERSLAAKKAALEAAREELRLKGDVAAKEAEAAKVDREKRKQKGGGEFAAGSAVGTFSAAGLFAMGGGSDKLKIDRDQLEALKQIDKKEAELIGIMKKQSALVYGS